MNDGCVVAQRGSWSWTRSEFGRAVVRDRNSVRGEGLELGKFDFNRISTRKFVRGISVRAREEGVKSVGDGGARCSVLGV